MINAIFEHSLGLYITYPHTQFHHCFLRESFFRGASLRVLFRLSHYPQSYQITNALELSVMVL